MIRIINEDKNYQRNFQLKQYIDISKSDSGINGRILRETHKQLGGFLVQEIIRDIKKNNINEVNVIRNKYIDVDVRPITIIGIERDGCVLSDSIQDKLELEYEKSIPKIYFNNKTIPINYFNNKRLKTVFKEDIFHCFIEENEEYLMNNNILLIDGVINSGNSILEIGEFLKEHTHSNIIYITNVIQKESIEKFKNKNLYCIRTSENKFIGSKVKVQEGNKGPDTGDRLFSTL